MKTVDTFSLILIGMKTPYTDTETAETTVVIEYAGYAAVIGMPHNTLVGVRLPNPYGFLRICQ